MTADAENTPARPPLPGPPPSALRPRSSAAAEPAPAAEPWGRVDESGIVSVREEAGWRVVGEYPDGTPDEALAYFTRKYADLAGEVSLLEARHRSGGASAAELRATAVTVQERLTDAAAVGDLDGLRRRLQTLLGALDETAAQEGVRAQEAIDDAIAARTALVEEMERLAAQDAQNVQWKQTTVELNALFEQWQQQQQSSPRLPKSVAQRLWKRFRDARAIVDRHRRDFYAQLDDTHREARGRKTALVERAEALAPRGEDGIPAYRDLLDDWKSSGRAGKKVDDALWARFKAAGDALYQARSVREAAEVEASREKIDAKQALLEEARTIPDEADLTKARAALTAIQRRWDEIGQVFPREQDRTLDSRLRTVEQDVRGREESDWKRNNPETKARANDMTRQLTEAIDKLEQELAAAQSTGDAGAISQAAEALQARRAWLKAVGG